MKKYNFKRKNKHFLAFISIIVIVISVCAGIGYSIFSSTLNIEGTVWGQYGELDDILENIMQPVTYGTEQYATIVATETPVNIKSESLENNTLTIYAEKADTLGKERDVDFTFQLKNIGKDVYTDGTYDVQYVNGGTFLKTTPTVTMPTTLALRETDRKRFLKRQSRWWLLEADWHTQLVHLHQQRMRIR